MTGEVFMSMWTVYDHPIDHPAFFVARKTEIVVGQFEPRKTDAVLFASTLEELRAKLPRGLTSLARFPNDDRKIVEVWL